MNESLTQEMEKRVKAEESLALIREETDIKTEHLDQRWEKLMEKYKLLKAKNRDLEESNMQNNA